MNNETTPKQDKKSKKSKRKSKEISLSPPANGDGDIINSPGPESERKKHKKEKKKKHKRKSKDIDTPSRDKPTEIIVPPQSATPHDKPKEGTILSLFSSDTTNIKSTPYQIKRITGSVALLPASLSSVSNKIRALLHSLLLRYDTTLGGVLLSLEDDATIMPLNDNNLRGSGLVGGRIIDDLPYVHYRFQVHGLAFCPSVGMKLKGQVIDCTQTFITLTTHHILSTKISTEKLHQQGFFFNTTTLEWSRERDTSARHHGNINNDEDDDGNMSMNDNDELGPSTSIYLDDTVEFVVEKIHECGGNVMLDGTQPSVSTLS